MHAVVLSHMEPQHMPEQPYLSCWYGYPHVSIVSSIVDVDAYERGSLLAQHQGTSASEHAVTALCLRTPAYPDGVPTSISVRCVSKSKERHARECSTALQSERLKNSILHIPTKWLRAAGGGHRDAQRTCPQARCAVPRAVQRHVVLTVQHILYVKYY